MEQIYNNSVQLYDLRNTLATINIKRTYMYLLFMCIYNCMIPHK